MVRCIASVGEASRQVLESRQVVVPPDAELIQAYWTSNRLVHGYFDVDPHRVLGHRDGVTSTAPGCCQEHAWRLIKVGSADRACQWGVLPVAQIGWDEHLLPMVLNDER